MVISSGVKFNDTSEKVARFVLVAELFRQSVNRLFIRRKDMHRISKRHFFLKKLANHATNAAAKKATKHIVDAEK
jgi:hypothetical protein